MGQRKRKRMPAGVGPAALQGRLWGAGKGLPHGSRRSWSPMQGMLLRETFGHPTGSGTGPWGEPNVKRGPSSVL